MDCYLLTVYVSLEQELAIRELFAYNGWHFNKYEDPAFGYECKQDTEDYIDKNKEQRSLEAMQTKHNGENSSIKNVGIGASPHSEIFSDLQHFVEATLIAAGEGNSKTECLRNKDDTADANSRKQSFPPDNGNDMSGLPSDTSPNREGDKAENDITGDCLTETNATVNKLKETNRGEGDDFMENDESLCASVLDAEMDEGSVCEESSGDTSCNMENMKQSLGVTINGLTCTQLVGKGTSTLLVQNNTDVNQDHEYKCEEDIRETVEMNEDANTNKSKAKKTKRDFKKRIAKERNTSVEKNRLKKEKAKQTENSNTSETLDRKKSKVGLFHCNECNNTFRLLGAYKNHKRDGKCRFECEFCGKIFTARYYSNYKSHLKYHMKDRSHKCDICGKSYIEAQTLKIHLRKHSGDRPYVCDHCGLQFYSSSHLLSHRNSAHSDSRQIHKCDICDASLSTLGNLRVHKKVVHAIDRPFTCEVCGKSFKTQKSLEQVHAKVHSEDFPYKCDFPDCGKTFKRSESLADHLRRHNNDRNHFCEKCGKGFYTNKDLMLHTRTHTGEKPHQCHLCDYKCALGGNLRKHMKTHQPPL